MFGNTVTESTEVLRRFLSTCSHHKKKTQSRFLNAVGVFQAPARSRGERRRPSGAAVAQLRSGPASGHVLGTVAAVAGRGQADADAAGTSRGRHTGPRRRVRVEFRRHRAVPSSRP